MGFARLAFRVLLGLLILLAVIGLTLPDSATVEREISIEAPVATVFPHINSMQAFHAWSPWTRGDPSTQYVFEGPEQGVGSRMRWFSGSEEVGQGSQEIIASVANQHVETSLVFGDKGSGIARFTLIPDAEGTTVRWQFHSDFGWDLFSRYVGLMLDGMIGAAYDKGLRTLKERIEGRDASSLTASGAR